MISVHVVLQRLLCWHWLRAHFAFVVKGAGEMSVLHVVQNIVFPRSNLSTYFTLELVFTEALPVDEFFDVFQQNVSVIPCKKRGRGSCLVIHSIGGSITSLLLLFKLSKCFATVRSNSLTILNFVGIISIEID